MDAECTMIRTSSKTLTMIHIKRKCTCKHPEALPQEAA